MSIASVTLSRRPATPGVFRDDVVGKRSSSISLHRPNVISANNVRNDASSTYGNINANNNGDNVSLATNIDNVTLSCLWLPTITSYAIVSW